MKIKLLAFILFFPLVSIAQESNIFHDRSFWKTSPDVATVKEEIKKGNDATVLTSRAFDALVYAILEDAPLETVKYLLSLDGNGVDKVTHDKRTYLMWAAYKGNIETMKFLIDQNSDTKVIDDHGYNLLTYAAVAGIQDTEVYDLILANGLTVKDGNREGANALMLLAPHLKDDKLITYFQKKGLDVHAKDDHGNGLFNYVARRGNMDMMEKLIDMGLDYKGLNKEGANAMIYASYGSRGYSNPLKVYEYLESKGIKANIVTNKGRTPLHNIVNGQKDPKVIEYFISKGVNVNQSDEDGNTAFLNAIRRNNIEIAKVIFPSIDDINTINKEGYSALTYAIMRNSLEASEFLMANGADIKVKDKKGRNLVYHIFNAYRKNSKDAFYAFNLLVKEAGLNLQPEYEGGNTLAHLAIKKEQEFLLLQALELGIDINQKNDEGLTPLHIAAMQAKNKKLLSVLLEQGADKGVLTEFDESAFDLAKENEILVSKGVNLGFLKVSETSSQK